jgi:predicted DNA-binding transcriptional regulator YafY
VRRADRLFQIVQRLRRRRVTTARALAEALGVSERTIYRDVQDLVLSGVPVQGEAGVGYALPKGFDLPPLMFSEDEIEALVLGARIVKAWADPSLQRAAEDALAKIEAVLPDRLRTLVPDAALFAPDFHIRQQLTAHLPPLRDAVRRKRKIQLAYADKSDQPTDRTVQPLGLFYWGHAWSLGAWCELRDGFRNFRVDRMREVRVLDEAFTDAPGRTLADFFRHYQDELRR